MKPDLTQNIIEGAVNMLFQARSTIQRFELCHKCPESAICKASIIRLGAPRYPKDLFWIATLRSHERQTKKTDVPVFEPSQIPMYLAFDNRPQARYSNLTTNFCRQRSPTLRRNKGTTPSPIAKNARRVFPHPRPNLSYIGRPASGIMDPAIARKMLAAAKALAAYFV